MPSITTTLPNLEGDGPVLEVHFSIPNILESQYRKSGKPIPEPIIVKALIDTGASSCVIQSDIPQKLGLQPVGATKINTPSCQDSECYQYFMRMILPQQGLFYEGVFTAAPLSGQNINSLIGRDVLKQGILIYIGYVNQFTFSLL